MSAATRYGLALGRTIVVFERVHPLGFLDSFRAQDAELLIGKAEGIVNALAPADVDLRPAQDALRAAKALFAAEAYSKALAQARRAAFLATSLNDRFTAYFAAWKLIQDCRRELERIGFPTDILDAALASADRETVRQVEEGGTLVPNYLGATALLERAAGEARHLVVLAKEASHDVFLATLAVEALSDSPSRSMPSWLAVRLEGLVERATQELARGNVPEARRIAAETRARADDARAGATRAWEILDLAAAMLDGLEAWGPLALELSKKVDSARAALGQGFLNRSMAIELARRISDDVSAFAMHYPDLRQTLEQQELELAVLRMEGFRSPSIEGGLQTARDALGRGEWEPAKESVETVAAGLARERHDREEIARGIAEIETRAKLLECFRLPMMPGVNELIDRATGAVQAWRLPDAREDLDLAAALMNEATRTGS